MSTISDRICVLYGGKVAEYGATARYWANPATPTPRA